MSPTVPSAKTPKRSNAIRHRSKSRGPSAKREASPPQSDGIIGKSTKTCRIQDSSSPQPQQLGTASPEAAAVLAKYAEKASAERLHIGQDLSGLASDWTSLQMLIKDRPNIKDVDVMRGINIQQRYLVGPREGDFAKTHEDLEEFFRSLPGGMQSEAEIEAALVLARRIVEYFYHDPKSIVKNPSSLSSSPPPKRSAAKSAEKKPNKSKPSKTAAASSSKPAESFEEMGVPASEDTEDRGRASRQDKFQNFNRAASRAASRVREKVKRSLSRSRPPTSRASSPQPPGQGQGQDGSSSNNNGSRRGKSQRRQVTRTSSPPVRPRGRVRRSKSVHGDPATRISRAGSTRRS
ncbi:Serine/arginine repetitive matrix protein 2 [Neopestalotiopsis sp. 37M]|nr:Serine/arginine repetitive matrix protein 2 [Neopestalotiopsis sp. 37M]